MGSEIVKNVTVAIKALWSGVGAGGGGGGGGGGVGSLGAGPGGGGGGNIGSDLVGALIGGGVGGAAHKGMKILAGMAGQAVGGPVGALLSGAVADKVGDVMDAFLHPIDTFKEIAGKIAGFVGAASPAKVERFNLAMKDMTALFGHGLGPAMDMMTDIVRSTADAFASSSLGKDMQGFFGDLRKLWEEAKPAAQVFMKLMADSIARFVQFGRQVVGVLQWIQEHSPKSFWKAARDNMGVRQGASFGLSAQSAGFVGAEEFGRQAAAATYSSGKSWAEQGVEQAKTTNEKLADIFNLVEGAMTAMTVTAGIRRGLLGF